MLRRLAFPFAVLAVTSASAGWATPAKVVAFGDSITWGAFDSPEGYGYPGRLDVRIGNAGWNADVFNQGVDGESTPEGLSRVGSVVAGGGEFFLLMEGTNDISTKGVSVETIVYNLDQIAIQAAAAGFKVAHASVIPRWPCATRDASNTGTADLASQVESLAASKGRAFVDPYDYFLSLPNLYSTYYANYSADCSANLPGDPGHPNPTGYGKLTDPFESGLTTLLSAGAAIKPPASPTAGSLVSFNASLFRTDYTKLVWEFGDGGKATVVPSGGSAPAASWIFTEPGTYKVQLTWTRADNSTGTVSKTITVGGSTPAWSKRISVVPLAFRGTGAAPDDLRFDLTLGNNNASSRIVEVQLLDESPDGEPLPLLDLAVEPPGLDVGETITALRERVPPEHFPRRRWLMPTSTTLPVSDLLATELSASPARGAALVTFFYTSGNEGNFSASGELYRAGHAAQGDTVAEIQDQSWGASARDLDGLEPTADLAIRVALTNLGSGDQVFHLTLHDGVDDPVASADLTVLKQSTATAALDELFPDLGSFSGPFRVAVDAATQPFVASAAAVDSATGTVTAIPSTP